MGELLLSGWAMLAENCPDCSVPLMKDRSTGVSLCVNCDARFKDGAKLAADAKGQRAPADHAQQSVAAPSTQTAAASGAASAPPAPPGDEVADAIGQKLQAGWALLGEHCPRCTTPLVRDRATRRMYCCSCDLWVLTEQQAAAAATAKPAAAPFEASAAAPTTTSDKPPAAAAQQQALASPGEAAVGAALAPLRGAGKPGGAALPGAGIVGLATCAQAPSSLLPTSALQTATFFTTGGTGVSALPSPVPANTVRLPQPLTTQVALGQLYDAVLAKTSEVAQALQATQLAGAGGVGGLETLERLVRLAGECMRVLERIQAKTPEAGHEGLVLQMQTGHGCPVGGGID